MVGEASGRMQKADCRDEIALPAAMLAWLKCGKQRTRNSRKRFLVFFCSLFVKARVVYRLLRFMENSASCTKEDCLSDALKTKSSETLFGRSRLTCFKT